MGSDSVRLRHYNFLGIVNVTSPLDINKCPLDKQKCLLDIQMSIHLMDEWTLSDSKHSSLLSTWGQTQSDYVITASLAS